MKQEGVGYEGEKTAGCQAPGAPALSAGGRRRRRRPSCSEEVERERKEKLKEVKVCQHILCCEKPVISQSIQFVVLLKCLVQSRL